MPDDERPWDWSDYTPAPDRNYWPEIVFVCVLLLVAAVTALTVIL